MFKKFKITISLTLLNIAYLFLIVIDGTRVYKLKWKSCAPSNIMTRKVYEVSLERCVEECANRPYCDALRYWRGRKLCELFNNQNDVTATDIWTSGIAQYEQGVGRSTAQKMCIEVQRQSLGFLQCICPDGNICENGNCVTHECPIINVENAEVWGNIRTIGSKAKVICMFGVSNNHVTRIATCTNGVWVNLPTCPNGYPDRAVLVGDWIISVWQNGVTYDTAKVLCTAYDGQLIKVQTHEKHTSIVEHLKSLKGDQTDFWIQGTRQSDGYTYRYEDDTVLPTDSFYWGYDEPNRYSEQYCIRMSSQWDYRWGDHKCSNNYGYICEYPNYLS